MNRHRPLILFVAAAGLVLAAAPLAAQPHPSHERGFDPAKVYQFGDLDSVNLLNGNLAVSIPIGPDYPVGGTLSYRLTLVYNSKVWDFVEAYYQGQPKSKALPERLSNAGMGWTLSLGRLLDPADPINDYEGDPWVYVSPDGSQHLFYASLGSPSGTGCGGTCYSRDSSYIRMRRLSATQRVLDLPDGSSHTFAKVSNTSEWRLTGIRDRFEAPTTRDLDVTYSLNGLTWTLTDKHGRVQKVIFEADPSGRYPRRLKRIELTAFAGTSPAVYQLSYLLPQSIKVSCASNFPGWTNVSVPLLSTLTLPDGSSFGMTYNHPTDGGDCRARGALRSLTLPTGGAIEYSYRLHTLPIMGCSYREWHSYSAGIATRRFRDAAGADLGPWNYSSQLSPSPATGSYSCDRRAFVPPSEQVAVTVVTPLLDKTVSYFSVWPGAEFPVTTGFDRDDYGQPFSKLPAVDGSGTRYLSTEVYDCDTAGGNCGSLGFLSLGTATRMQSTTLCGLLIPQVGTS